MKLTVLGLLPLAVSSLLLVVPALAAVPSEVQSVDWCPGQKDCLGWTATAEATSYTLYRGTGGSVTALADGAPDSCTVGGFTATTAAGIAHPPAGDVFWYLVTASNLEGEGSAGASSDGERSVDSVGPCAASGGLVINEIDYDQPGTDFDEFVEIRNTGSEDRDLAGVVLIFVNGLSSFEYARIELADAAASLPSGGYLVVGSPTVQAGLPAGVPSTALPGSSNTIQNGAPDGVALFDTVNGTLLDALSYEGSITAAQFDGVPGTFDLVEGTPTAAADSNAVTGSLVRFPDGSDSDDASVDWSFTELPTPGSPNAGP